MLRPYCSLTYAWDEPALPHRLVLELPGSRMLGKFLLDKVRGHVASGICVLNVIIVQATCIHASLRWHICVEHNVIWRRAWLLHHALCTVAVRVLHGRCKGAAWLL